MPVESVPYHRELRVAGAAGTAFTIGAEWSLWQMEGSPSHGDVPGAWANPDNTTPGSLRQSDAAAGLDRLIAHVTGVIACGGVLTIWDRLGHVGGLSGTTITAQDLNGGSPAAPSRHYQDVPGVLSDDGVEIFAEIHTTVGTTATTISAAYVNSAGASKTTQSVTFGATGAREAQRWIRLPLADGDTGVQSATSATLVASTGTAGAFGIVLAKRIVEISAGAAGLPFVESYVAQTIPKIAPGACLFATIKAGSASSALQSLADLLVTFVDK